MENKIIIWEGIYENFKTAGGQVTGLGFNGDIWLKRSLSAANECLESLKTGRPIPPSHKQLSALLPHVAAMMLKNGDKLRILDFGGGLGIGYMTLAESIPLHTGRISYTIIEVPQICRIGRKLFQEYEYITFKEKLPAHGKFELIYLSSVLQYIEDWRHFLKSLCRYGAPYILLSDVCAGSCPTFATLQNYYGSRIRSWFFNFDEMIDFFSSMGYQLVKKKFASSSRLGIADILPMGNFPRSHRVKKSLHILLRRNF